MGRRVWMLTFAFGSYPRAYSTHFNMLHLSQRRPAGTAHPGLDGIPSTGIYPTTRSTNGLPPFAVTKVCIVSRLMASLCMSWCVGTRSNCQLGLGMPVTVRGRDPHELGTHSKMGTSHSLLALIPSLAQLSNLLLGGDVVTAHARLRA